MKQYAKRMLAWMLAATLIIGCAISGLVLPAAAEDDNLLQNGDFEQGAVAPWTAVNSLITVEDGVGYGGGKALQFAAGGATDIYLKQLSLSLEPNSKYEISFLTKGPRIRVTKGTSTDIGTLYEYSTPHGDDWVITHTVFETAAAPSIDKLWGLYFRRDDTTTEPTYLDNVVIRKFLPEDDRIFDGSFNTVATQQWSTYFLSKSAQGIELVTEAGGNRALKIPAMTATPGDMWVRNLNLETNTTYTLKFKAKGAPINVFLYQVAGGGWKITEASEDWKEYTYEFTTQATVDSHFTVNVTRNQAATLNTTADTLLDDFSLVKKPTIVEATAIALNKTATTINIGSSETLTATVTPDGATFDPITWKSSDEAVATVVDGKVTAVAAGTATITATTGALSATCTVTVPTPAAPPPVVPDGFAMPNGTFDAAESGWKYTSTVDGLFNKNDPVPVMTDANGNRYIQIPANGKTIQSPVITCDIAAKDVIKISFKVRKTEAGKMRFGVQVQGGMYNGYQFPNWIATSGATSTNSDDMWITYTFYAQAAKAASSFYLVFEEVPGNTTADLKLDLDDVTVSNLGQVALESINAFTEGDMNEPSYNLNGYGYDGAFTDGAEIVTDPDDANNKVLHIPAGTKVQAWLAPSTFINSTPAMYNIKKDTVYRLTYRMKGPGTTSMATTGAYASILQTIGEPNKASETWKDITVYFKTAASTNVSYTFNFGNSGEVYIDDLCLYEVTDADSIVLDKTAVEDMMPGDTVTVTATTTPVGFNVTWATSDANVATVENGVIKAIGEGTATITATAGTKTATVSVKVTDPGKATAITLNKTEVYLVKGESETLTVTTEPTASRYDALTWATSDATLATVVDGVVTAAADKTGEVTITATAMVDGTPLTATCKVTVVGNATAIEATVEELHLAPSINNGTLAVTETIDLKVTPTGAYTGTLTWTSSDETVATVVDGKVKALAAGTATITVSNGTLSDTVTVKVDDFGERITGGDFEGDDWNVPYWTTSIIKEGNGQLVADPLNPDNTVLSIAGGKTSGWFIWPMQVNPGRTYKVSFKAMNADGKVMCNYFESVNSVIDGGWRSVSIAKEGWVEVSYLFTTKGENINRNYTIGFGNHAASTLYIDDYSVVELPEATALELSCGDTYELMPGGTATLSAVTVPVEASAGKLTWTSSAPSIISVNDSGLLTAVGESGSAVITVTNPKGLTDSVTVTINEYANLLENGDFEKGNTYWGAAWAEQSIQPGIGKDGSYGFRVHNTSGSSRVESYYKKAIPVQPSTTYVLTFDYYATDSSASLRIYSGTLGIGSKYAANGKGEWKTATKVFTTPAEMKLNTNWDLAIVCDGEGAEDIVIDNICVKLYDSGVEATSIRLSQETMTLLPGRTGALSIAATPTDGDINRSVWTSSDENVATVEYGVVTAVGKGTATITATTRSGLTATCVVTVSGEEALVKNGTFSTTDNWTTTGESKVTEGVGSIAKDGTLSQTVTGLKPDTTYQLFLRYRSNVSGSVGVNLTDGTTALLDVSQTVATAWTKKTLEFTTPATIGETATLTFAVASGNGPIEVDYIILAQKASLVDLKVDSIVWTDGEQVKPGTEIAFAVTFGNYGEDPVKAGAIIHIDICMDSKPIQTLEYTVGPNGFNPGDTDMLIGDEMWAAVEGDHVISARVNSKLSVLEANVDNNNTVQADLRVAEEFIETPEIAENAGFTHLTFSDDFNSLHTIDQYGTGADGYKWYITRPYSAPNVETDDYSIQDGYMNLRLKQPNYNYGLGTRDIKTGLGYEFKFGYMEFRIRMHSYDEEGEGGPAIWSLPFSKLTNNCPRWVEMDWMEYWGTKHNKNGYYTVTMHDNTSGYSEGEHWYRNKNASQSGMSDGEWHTLSFLWDYGVVIAYMDGEEVMRQTYDADGETSPMPNINKGDNPFPVDAFEPMNEQVLPIFICGSLDNQMDIDYIRVWTGAGGGTIPDDESKDEDEDGDGGLDGDVSVDIAADEFVYNFCTDIYGDDIFEVTEENYASVLGIDEEGNYMAQIIWELLSDERKAEINALLKANGQPTFDELLTAALAIANGEVGDDEGDETPSPDTGATSALPAAAALAMTLCLAALVFFRKRHNA